MIYYSFANNNKNVSLSVKVFAKLILYEFYAI